jgi:hypothetical protein
MIDDREPGEHQEGEATTNGVNVRVGIRARQGMLVAIDLSVMTAHHVKEPQSGPGGRSEGHEASDLSAERPQAGARGQAVTAQSTVRDRAASDPTAERLQAGVRGQAANTLQEDAPSDRTNPNVLAGARAQTIAAGRLGPGVHRGEPQANRIGRRRKDRAANPSEEQTPDDETLDHRHRRTRRIG